MACTCLFKEEKKINWLKCWQAFHLVQKGLNGFITTEIQRLHTKAFGHLPINSLCKASTLSHTCDEIWEILISQFRRHWETPMQQSGAAVYGSIQKVLLILPDIKTNLQFKTLISLVFFKLSSTVPYSKIISHVIFLTDKRSLCR